MPFRSYTTGPIPCCIVSERTKNAEAVTKLFLIRLLSFKLVRQDREYQHHHGYEITTEVSGSGSGRSTIPS